MQSTNRMTSLSIFCWQSLERQFILTRLDNACKILWQNVTHEKCEKCNAWGMLSLTKQKHTYLMYRWTLKIVILICFVKILFHLTTSSRLDSFQILSCYYDNSIIITGRWHMHAKGDAFKIDMLEFKSNWHNFGYNIESF